jgi:prepilin-type N-terminal cleavage/methylation domain-containing protein
MLNKFIKAFTLVEMLVALAVSSIIIAATYASYEMVATQYKKNMDVADMHTSGRAIMRIIERDVRMAGFEYRDKDAKIPYGTISNPLVIKDSGNKCCDEVTVIYDYAQDSLSWKGKVVSSKVDRIRVHYWTEAYSSNKGVRHRLYKQKDILGQNKKILAKPKLGTKDVMADYIEDLQFDNANATSSGSSDYIKIDKNGKELPDSVNKWSCVKDKKTGLIWEVKTTDNGIHNGKKVYRWGGGTSKKSGQYCASMKYHLYAKWRAKKQLCDVAGKGFYYPDWNNLVNGSNNEKLCGEVNWRVPNQDELMSIMDFNKAPRDRSNLMMNMNYFKKGAYFFPNYWTNLPWPTSPRIGNSAAVNVNFWSGTSNNVPRRIKLGVRLVHDGSKGASGVISLFNINLTLRTKNQYGKDRQFKKKDYHAGNYKLDKTDKYKRDTFSSTVLVRNLAL